MTDITSANSVFTLVIPGVIPAPFNVEGYAADDAFTTDAVDLAETLMGVDGKMSAGYTPVITPLTVMLQADSPSISVFDAWLGAMEASRQIFVAQATIVLPAVAKSYVFTKGVLKSAKRFPDAKKILQPVQYVIHWERVTAVPIG